MPLRRAFGTMDRVEHSIARSAGITRRAHAWAVARRLAPLLGIAALVVAVDQLTKAAVRDWLSRGETWPSGDGLIRLAHVENTGAAFGIFEGGGLFLVISSLVGAVAVLAYLLVVPPGDRLLSAALALVLGGAVGNLIDRVARGSVTDFIDPTHYPAFNLADSAIVVGVGALVVISFLHTEDDRASDGKTDS